MDRKGGGFAKELWNAAVGRLGSMPEDGNLGKMKLLCVWWMLCATYMEVFVETEPVSQDKLQAAMDVLAKGHDVQATGFGDDEGNSSKEDLQY